MKKILFLLATLMSLTMLYSGDIGNEEKPTYELACTNDIGPTGASTCFAVKIIEHSDIGSLSRDSNTTRRR